MRILMLLDNEFPPDIRVENEAFSLIKAGHEIHLLTYAFCNKPLYESYNSINIHRFKISKQVSKKLLGLIHIFPLYKLIWIIQLRKKIKNYSFDAIHIHDLPLCILSNYIKKHFKCLVIADMHENYPHLVSQQPYMNSLFGRILLSKKIWFKKEKEWLNTADYIICVANEMKDRIKKIIFNDNIIKVVPNTINFNSFLKSQIRIIGLNERFKDSFNLLYLGGLDPVRGIELLLEAGAYLTDLIKELKIILVGDGNIVSELLLLSEKLNIKDKVFFEGWQAFSHIQSYVEIADICIIPHLRSEHTDNTSPNKIFQFMYFKKPIIVSNCIYMEKIIKETSCGMVFTDRNSKDLSDKIYFLYTNPVIRNEMGRNGHKAVLEKFNWENTSKGLLEIYKS